MKKLVRINTDLMLANYVFLPWFVVYQGYFLRNMFATFLVPT